MPACATSPPSAGKYSADAFNWPANPDDSATIFAPEVSRGSANNSSYPGGASSGVVAANTIVSPLGDHAAPPTVAGIALSLAAFSGALHFHQPRRIRGPEI